MGNRIARRADWQKGLDIAGIGILAGDGTGLMGGGAGIGTM